MDSYCDGKLLVSPPGMRDKRFEKTVIYIWKHDISGASGVIINKPLPLNFSKICKDSNVLKTTKAEPSMYYGGPTLENCVGTLHTNDVIVSSSNVNEDNDIIFTLDRRLIEKIAVGTGPSNFLITMGMAQWSPQQLETELEALPPRKKSESWLVLNSDPELIWNSNHPNFWNSCLNMAVAQSSREFTSNFFR